jgi:hypothetical protein
LGGYCRGWLLAELRHRRGVSYVVDAGYEALGSDHAMVTALVDALPDQRQAAADGFVDVLTDLAGVSWLF